MQVQYRGRAAETRADEDDDEEEEEEVEDEDQDEEEEDDDGDGADDDGDSEEETDSAPLSAYDQLRANNIKRNHGVLNELGLNTGINRTRKVRTLHEAMCYSPDLIFSFYVMSFINPMFLSIPALPSSAFNQGRKEKKREKK